ncbi:VOC family protein [Mycobacterium kyogaense]|uniref:VOC family protein n=1 Tax=Mycobacterium kyogaense TaxID=2212479 RepID=UPI000DACB0DC|nr:VOC family protein [Mycobacterium kyogaense]
MGANRVAVVVESQDPLLLGDFWARMVECRLTVDSTTGRCATDLGGNTDVRFVPAVQSHSDANRQHIDLASDSPEHHAALIGRALDLGALRADVGQGNVPWQVMADPEGNEFCILEPRGEYRQSGSLAAVVTHAEAPLTVGRFWSALVGAPMIRTHPEYTSVRYGGTADPALEFVRHPNPPEGQGRLHLQLLTRDGFVHPTGAPAVMRPCPVCGEPSAALTDPEHTHLCMSADCSPAENP